MSPRCALIIGVGIVLLVVAGLSWYVSDLPGAGAARAFFVAHKDALSGLSTALSIVGFAAVVVTFMLALNTLRLTVIQNRAKVSFDVYKEVRAFFEKKEAPRPDVVFNFYLSLFEQKQYGNVDEAFWGSVCRDIFSLFSEEMPEGPFNKYWEDRGSQYPDPFRSEINRIRSTTLDA